MGKNIAALRAEDPGFFRISRVKFRCPEIVPCRKRRKYTSEIKFVHKQLRLVFERILRIIIRTVVNDSQYLKRLRQTPVGKACVLQIFAVGKRVIPSVSLFRYRMLPLKFCVFIYNDFLI